MTVSGSSELGAFLRLLRENGLAVEEDSGSPTVAPRGHGGPRTTIDLPQDLLVAYLDRVGRSHSPFDDDPRAAARGLLAVQLAGDLTADHGDGVNRVRHVALVDGPVDGQEGPQLVEERTDDPAPRPVTGDAPHDDPMVFAAELEALAAELRARDLPATADAARAAIDVVVHERTVVVDLRPDRYRAYLEAQEEELEAIGGDAREHAWCAWCRRVVSLLTGDTDVRRLSFVATADGEVGLVPDAEGDDAPPASGVWSAEPGW